MTKTVKLVGTMVLMAISLDAVSAAITVPDDYSHHPRIEMLSEALDEETPGSITGLRWRCTPRVYFSDRGAQVIQ